MIAVTSFFVLFALSLLLFAFVLSLVALPSLPPLSLSSVSPDSTFYLASHTLRISLVASLRLFFPALPSQISDCHLTSARPMLLPQIDKKDTEASKAPKKVRSWA